MENVYTNNSTINQRELDLLFKPRRVKIQISKRMLYDSSQGEVSHLVQIVIEHVCVLSYIHMLKMSKVQSCIVTK